MNNPTYVTYQRPNKFFLSCIGLWPHQKTMEKRFFLLSSIFFVVTQGLLQIGGLIMSWENTDIFMESVPPVIVDFMCYVKFLNFIYNADKMKKLLLMIEDDWERYGVGEELAILRNFGADCRKKTFMYAEHVKDDEELRQRWYSRDYRKLGKMQGYALNTPVNLAGGAVYGLMSPFMLVPLVTIIMGFMPSDKLQATNETIVRPLMFHVENLVDVDKWYYYLLLHSYIATMVYITIVVAIDSMLLAYVQHACTLFALIGYRLEHLVENDELEVDMYPPINEDKPYRNMIECISRHSLVIEYVEGIEDANTTSLFLQLNLNVFCLIFTGFQAVTNLEHPEESFRYASFMVAQIFPVFCACYPSQSLITESMRILECFTNTSWYLTSIRTRKLLNLMILRSMRPCSLTALNFWVLDMQFFAAVMRSAMSYLNMLYSFG